MNKPRRFRVLMLFFFLATQMLEPLAFIHAPHQVQPETRPLPQAETPRGPGLWVTSLKEYSYNPHVNVKILKASPLRFGI